MNYNLAVRHSALWAAYGDALGFVSELASSANLKQRAGVSELRATLPWKRRIGGKFGVNITLPPGCYSDDTQLRLSISRAIDGKGHFDVEAFAKVELPIWTSYALGAGRGSKCAALSISRRNATWNNNFFVSDDLNYVNMGGNGAAMRIQPHVWCFSSQGDLRLLIRDIIRDSVVTHGHLRGILGAVFHGLALLHVLRHQEVPSPDDWGRFLQELTTIPQIVKDDDQLSYVWLQLWENASSSDFKDECDKVIEEMHFDITKIKHFLIDKEISQYHDMIEAIDGFSAESKGSATKTAILANALAYLASGDAEKAIVVSANELGSDTDTIGTMAGAIAGAVTIDPPTGKLMDYDYIVSEADRMYKISVGEEAVTFSYPDLLSWTPPNTQLDILYSTPQGMRLSALGDVVQIQKEIAGESNSVVWNWFRSSYGQTFLIKHRHDPKIYNQQNNNRVGQYRTPTAQAESYQDTLFPHEQVVTNERRPSEVHATPFFEVRLREKKNISVDDALDMVIKSKFDPNIIGQMFINILDNDDNVERCIAFAALVGKSRIVRKGK
jgi:ADP-ribosylglycohydrolase